MYFIDEDKEIYNMTEVVDRFNNFFVNVGPELASKIPDPVPSLEKNVLIV